jgi:TonB-dependent SusC/RagA subfamily outer membrane receptor
MLHRFSANLFTTPPIEKIYVHTDKTLYLPGEDIWFSAYLVREGSHRPTDISDVIYVELINPKGNVTAVRRLAADQGFTHGDFHLDEDDAGGRYTLRAYTQWMKNFGEEAFFTKKLTVQKVVTPRVLMKLDFEKEAYGSGEAVTANFKIRNLQDDPIRSFPLHYTVQLGGEAYARGAATTDIAGESIITFDLPAALATNDGLLNISVDYEGFSESISRSVPIVLNRIDLQFFPEGGTFIAGFINRVAFKALNEFGKPADVSGRIVDEQDRSVATFESFHDGMGAVLFEPKAGRSYRAVLAKPIGIEHSYPLPIVQADGLLLQVEKADRKEVQLAVYTRQRRKVHLLLHQGDSTFFAGDYQLQPGRNPLQIPTENAYAGTALITVLDEAGIPQNERLVFINPQQRLNIRLETEQESYTPGQEVQLKIRTTNEQDQAVPARLSLAVVDDRLITFADDKQDNMLSALLMSSELKGEIHEPAFYFDQEEPKAAQALDYVLLTHGWRKFEWREQALNADAFAYEAETIEKVSGVIRSVRTNQPLQAKVYALELSPDRKITEIRTDENGKFVIKGVNPAFEVMLLAKAPFRHRKHISIQVDAKHVYGGPAAGLGAAVVPVDAAPVPRLIKAEVVDEAKVTARVEPEIAAGEDLSLALNADAAALDEVVVVGYAVQAKKDLTGSVAVVEASAINSVLQPDIASVLQGRVEGVNIARQSMNYENINLVSIRGTSSIANQQPLIVLDGIPLTATVLNQVINLPDIETIQVLKGPMACAVYGSRGANGVIVVTTKKNWWDFNYGPSEDKFARLVVDARGFYQSRKFYQPQFSRKDDAARQRAPSTVFWAPEIVTDEQGEALVHFTNSAEVSNFRITVEGIAGSGRLGRQEHTLHTTLPVSVASKVPPFVCFGDTLWIPIVLRNNTDREVSGALQIDLPEALEVLDTLPAEVTIDPQTSRTEWLPVRVGEQEGKFACKAGFVGAGHSDAQEQEITILPMGFPVSASLAGYAHSKTFSFDLHEPIPGSLRAGFTGYTNVLDELMDGVRSIIQEPYGCFEQTSSSTYPNVLALHLMKTFDLDDTETEKRALTYIRQGYKRLLGFETAEGGFEWFGETPPHEGLTAYGLMEFHDMQQVYKGVDRQMIARTTDWLLGRRDGNGGFERSKKALDSFGRSSKEVSDAYITYAFTEIGQGERVRPEFDKAWNEAQQSKDAYRMALMANAALNLHETEKATLLIDELILELGEAHDRELKADHSMVRSYGSSLQVEIRALLLMALLKEEQGRPTAIFSLVQYLSANRQDGGFGSTQATILALKALSAYAQRYSGRAGQGRIDLVVNDQPIAGTTFDEHTLQSIRINQLEDHFSSGQQSVAVRLSGKETPVAYALDLHWRSLTPAASPDCKLAIRTGLSTHEIRLGETVRMDIALENKTNEGLPMSMALVGIPAGMSVQPWQLKELQEKRIFDFYELWDNYLVLYYREMAPGAIRKVALDLKSELPGTFRAPAGSAYLYYTAEDKDWIEGEKVVIERSEE